MISVEKHDHAVVVTLGGCEGANLLTIQNLAELHKAVDGFSNDNTCRAIIICGTGNRFFSAGADLNELAGLDGESSLKFSRLGQSLFEKLEHLDKIVIAAVDGFCMGGGLDLLLACDLRYATERSLFAHPGSRMGIITGFGGTVRLPAEIGRAFAGELLFTGRTFDAQEALRIGLINGIESPQELMNNCITIAGKAAYISPILVYLWKTGAAQVHVDEEYSSG